MNFLIVRLVSETYSAYIYKRMNRITIIADKSIFERIGVLKALSLFENACEDIRWQIDRRNSQRRPFGTF